MIQPVEPGRIEKLAAGFVMRQRIVLPAIPKPLHHVQIFGGNLIPHVMRGMLRLAVIGCTAFQPGGHDVPARAPAADMVERRELPGNVIRLAIAHGERAHQADMLGDARKRRENGDRLEPVEVMRAGLRGDEDAIRDEQKIEFPGFGELGLALIIAKICAGAGLRVRVAPVPPADAIAVQDES